MEWENPQRRGDPLIPEHDPADVDLVKAVGKQLEGAGYGLVEFTSKGWRWKG